MKFGVRDVGSVIIKILYSRWVKKKVTHIVGIDEAGRGPLAGPVSIGVTVIPKGFKWTKIPHVGDSKKVSPQRREVIFRQTQDLKKQGLLDYAVVLVSNTVIDTKGISYAIKSGIEKALKKLNLDPETTEVKLDGSLKAPIQFMYQETIIKGDAKEKSIGLASIMAKVTRDEYMKKMAKKYPEYGFEIHKGYGTVSHRMAIKRLGIARIHRSTFIH